MKVLGVGVDIIECHRIRQLVAKHGKQFIHRVYTPIEVDYCKSRRFEIEAFAERWAAKEAVLKAIGTGWAQGTTWRDVEVQMKGSKPGVLLHGASHEISQRIGVSRFEITVAHCATFAISQCLALG